jgi:hypothetical protein
MHGEAAIAGGLAKGDSRFAASSRWQKRVSAPRHGFSPLLKWLHQLRPIADERPNINPWWLVAFRQHLGEARKGILFVHLSDPSQALRHCGHLEGRIRNAQFGNPQSAPDFRDRNRSVPRRHTPSRRPRGSMNFRSFDAVNGLRPPKAARLRRAIDSVKTSEKRGFQEVGGDPCQACAANDAMRILSSSHRNAVTPFRRQHSTR